jgi:hypothetical protein
MTDHLTVNSFGARAIVTQHMAAFGVGIYLIEDRPYGATAVAQPAELILTDHDPYATLPDRPTLLLPDNHARALLDALSAHYGAHSDVRSLRKDYDAERARVDMMLAAILPPRVRGA